MVGDDQVYHSEDHVDQVVSTKSRFLRVSITVANKLVMLTTRPLRCFGIAPKQLIKKKEADQLAMPMLLIIHWRQPHQFTNRNPSFPSSIHKRKDSGESGDSGDCLSLLFFSFGCCRWCCCCCCCCCCVSITLALLRDQR